MPYENLPESEWSKMDSCVQQVQEQGKSKEAAIAICYVSIAGKVDINEAIKRIDAGSVKAAKDYTLDVLGVPFNTTDSDGEYFTKATNIYSAVSDTPLVLYYHTIVPGGTMDNLTAQPEVIGTAKYNHQDDAGHWWKVTLDMTKKIAQQVWNAAKSGMARVSSGTAQHLKRVNPTGEITSWAVVELSLIDASAGLKPANKYAIALPALKAELYKNITLPEVLPEGVKPDSTATTNLKSIEVKMTPEEIKLYVEQLVKEMMGDNMEAAAPAEAAQAEDPNAKLKAEIKQMVEAAFAEAKTKSEAKTADVASTITNAVKSAFAKQAAEAGRLPYTEAPKVLKFGDTRKYDNVAPEDLAFAIDVIQGSNRQASQLAIKALAQKVLSAQFKHSSYVKAAMPEDAIKGAADPMYNYTAIGTEWIGTAYATQIWDAIRANTRVVGKIPSVVIPDGYSSQYFPVESTDPTWYKVAETSAADATMKIPVASVTASQVTTATKQLSVAKMGARIMYSGEMVEDSLIPFAEQLRAQLAKSGAEMMEHVVIDGDTATSSNINDIGGTTYSGAATTLFLLTNGFRKSCLVTTTANSRSAAGALQIEDFLSTMKLMGTGGLYAADLAKASFIVDANTWWAMQNLPELKTKDVSSAATVENGFISRVYGYEVIPSWFMHYRQTSRLANTAGKVDLDTAGNNLYGAILGVRWDAWKLGYKRRMTIETTRRPESDSWEITALTRWGLAQRDTEASAVSYYVGV